MDTVFSHPGRNRCFWTVGCGNCRALESVENGTAVFHPSHRAWKTRQTAPSFPQFPQPLPLEIVINKRKGLPLKG